MTPDSPSSFEDALGRRQSAVIMVELPTDDYLDASVDSLRRLTSAGFRGVYVSFLRPSANLAKLLNGRGVDVSKVSIIDVASPCLDSPDPDAAAGACPSPSKLNIDDLVRAIYTSLGGIDSPRKFIFIDSLTTIAFYKQLSEVMRFSQFLIDSVKRHKYGDVVLVFNVASDLRQKPFIRDVALHVDEVVAVAG